MYDRLYTTPEYHWIIHKSTAVNIFKYAIYSSKRLFLASQLSCAQSRDLNLHILSMIGIRNIKL